MMFVIVVVVVSTEWFSQEALIRSSTEAKTPKKVKMARRWEGEEGGVLIVLLCAL